MKFIKAHLQLTLAFWSFLFVMEILFAYCSNLTGQISALAGFTYMIIVSQHTMPVGWRWAFKGRIKNEDCANDYNFKKIYIRSASLPPHRFSVITVCTICVFLLIGHFGKYGYTLCLSPHPKFCIKALFLFSLGTIVKYLGGQTKSLMVFSDNEANFKTFVLVGRILNSWKVILKILELITFLLMRIWKAQIWQISWRFVVLSWVRIVFLGSGTITNKGKDC